MQISDRTKIYTLNTDTTNRKAGSAEDTYEVFRRKYPAEGYLKAQVYAGQQGFPIPGVQVEVSKQFARGMYVFDTQVTDVSGLTQPVALPTSPAALSQDPGHMQPYATYDIRLSHPDYTEVIVRNVGIFEGVVALQPMEMLPKGAAPGGRRMMEYNVRQAPLPQE